LKAKGRAPAKAKQILRRCAPQDDNEKHKRAKNLAGVIATERVEGSRERRGERQSLRSGFFLSLLKAVP
jgi:hypothetical protein